MAVYTPDIPELDTRYARDVSLPMQFDADCDLLLDEDQEVIEQSLQLLTFIPQGSFRLFPDLGSAAQLAVFDPLDEETTLIFDTSLRNAFETLEPRVFLDKEFTFDETADEQKLVVIVPYKIKVTGDLAASRFVIPRPLAG